MESMGWKDTGYMAWPILARHIELFAELLDSIHSYNNTKTNHNRQGQAYMQ